MTLSTGPLDSYREALIIAGNTDSTIRHYLYLLNAMSRETGTPHQELTDDHVLQYARIRDHARTTITANRFVLRRYRKYLATGHASPARNMEGIRHQKWAGEFIDWVMRGGHDGRRRTRGTAENYCDHVVRVAEFAGVHPSDLAQEHLWAFLDAKNNERKVSYPYLNAIMRSCAIYSVWAGRPGTLDAGRFKEADRCNPINPDPVEDDLLYAMEDMATPHEYAMLTLGTECGARAHEIGKACREDFTPKGHRVRVRIHGKYGTRDVWMDTAAYEELLPIMPESGRLFPMISEDVAKGALQVAAILKNLAYRAGGEQFHSHQLRHWSGSTVYQVTDKDIRKTQDHLGHKNLNTTARYVDVWDDDDDTAALLAAHRRRRREGGRRNLRAAG